MSLGYFSLDLDFWWASKSPVDAEFVDRLIGCFKGHHCIAAFDHHDVLPHVSRYWDQCDILVNQDWHNDFGGYDLNGLKYRYWRKPELNCGTWVDHVWWTNMNLYVWGYPTEECAKPDGDGRCDDISYDAFEHGHSDWKEAVLVHAKQNRWYDIQFNKDGTASYILPNGEALQLTAMSVVLSMPWAGDDAKGVFMRMVKRHNLRIIDGLGGKTRRAQKRS